MGLVDDNPFPKVIYVEGSAPATPASGTVVVYAKADGLIYSKDDAGVETLVSGGAGGGGGGGGGATITTPHLYQAVRANGTNTITAAASGRRLVCCLTAFAGSVTAIATTNVTWTQMSSNLASGSNNTAIWVGVVAGGASGTSVTFTGTGTILNQIVEIADTLTPTLDQAANATNGSAFGGISARLTSATVGAFVAMAGMTDNTTTTGWGMLSAPFVSFPSVTAVQATGSAFGYAPSGDLSAIYSTNGGSSGSILVVSVV